MKRIFPVLLMTVIIFNAGILSAIISRSVASVSMPITSLKNGDLILRNGKGMVSHWFRRMSLHDQQFSHAGLINIVGNTVFVLHAYQESNPSGLIKETLDQFINPDLCDKYAIYRYDLDNHQREKVHENMLNDLNSKIPFDDAFELNNGRAVYCTEWIHDCLNTSLNDSNYIPKSIVKDFSFISPDNLYLNSHAYKLLQKQY